MHMHLRLAATLLTVIVKDQLIEVASRGLHPDILVYVISAVQTQADGVSQRLAGSGRQGEKHPAKYKCQPQEGSVCQQDSKLSWTTSHWTDAECQT